MTLETLVQRRPELITVIPVPRHGNPGSCMRSPFSIDRPSLALSSQGPARDLGLALTQSSHRHLPIPKLARLPYPPNSSLTNLAPSTSAFSFKYEIHLGSWKNPQSGFRCSFSAGTYFNNSRILSATSSAVSR